MVINGYGISSYTYGWHRHRLDGPAVISREYKRWYKDGMYHRLEGECIVGIGNNKPYGVTWVFNGYLHGRGMLETWAEKQSIDLCDMSEEEILVLAMRFSQ